MINKFKNLENQYERDKYFMKNKNQIFYNNYRIPEKETIPQKDQYNN